MASASPQAEENKRFFPIEIRISVLKNTKQMDWFSGTSTGNNFLPPSSGFLFLSHRLITCNYPINIIHGIFPWKSTSELGDSPSLRNPQMVQYPPITSASLSLPTLSRTPGVGLRPVRHGQDLLEKTSKAGLFSRFPMAKNMDFS